MRAAPLLVAVALTACAPAGQEGPDLILTGGTVYMAGLESTAAAVAIDDNRIAATGTDREIRALAGDRTQEMALEGVGVYAGFIDWWLDPEALGRWQQEPDLSLAASTREVQARVRALTASGRGWILGHGWNETVWPDGQLPDREALDAITRERPVLLYRRTGDIGWVNSAALQEAGIEPSAPGAFTDAEGRLTGIVGGPALRRVEAALPQATDAVRRQWLADGLMRVAAAGITTVVTAPVDAQTLRLLRQLEASGDLPVRVRARLRPGTLVRVPAAGTPADDEAAPSVRVTALGLTLDGPFRPALAALSEPYPAGGSGSLWVDAAAIEEACREAQDKGLELHVRVRGDRALATALDSCPGLASGAGMVVGGDLLPRPPTELSGLRLAIAPARLTHDLYWLEEALGAERAARTHPYQDALAAGIVVGLASEAPEHPLAPMRLLRVLETRKDAEGYPLDGWVPGQRVSIAAALRVSTGELRAGDIADLVVWSEDPLAGGDPMAAQAMVTIVGGRVVYSRPLVDLPFEMQ